MSLKINFVCYQCSKGGGGGWGCLVRRHLSCIDTYFLLGNTLTFHDNITTISTQVYYWLLWLLKQLKITALYIL